MYNFKSYYIQCKLYSVFTHFLCRSQSRGKVKIKCFLCHYNVQMSLYNLDLSFRCQRLLPMNKFTNLPLLILVRINRQNNDYFVNHFLIHCHILFILSTKWLYSIFILYCRNCQSFLFFINL